MTSRVEHEIKKAEEFAHKMEQFVDLRIDYSKDERTMCALAYWSLGFELHRAILAMLTDGYLGAAFALVRPQVETTVRAQLVLFVSEDILKSILDDTFRTRSTTVGKQIDEALGMGVFFDNFLQGARNALHGYTHIGMHQVGRRFRGTELAPNFSEGEIVGLIRVSVNSVYLVTSATLIRLGSMTIREQASKLFVNEYRHK